MVIHLNRGVKVPKVFTQVKVIFHVAIKRKINSFSLKMKKIIFFNYERKHERKYIYLKSHITDGKLVSF